MRCVCCVNVPISELSPSRLQSESGKEVLFPLKTFRKNRRLAIVVGGPTAVAEAREMATQGQQALCEVGAIVVPVELKELRDENSPPPSYASEPGWILPCLAVPVREQEWREWVETEITQARAQGLDLEQGCTIYVERSGYIKKRQSGVPAWQVLAADTQARNRPYGMPELGVDY